MQLGLDFLVTGLSEHFGIYLVAFAFLDFLFMNKRRPKIYLNHPYAYQV